MTSYLEYLDKLHDQIAINKLNATRYIALRNILIDRKWSDVFENERPVDQDGDPIEKYITAEVFDKWCDTLLNKP
jgi:hypothetical protein